MARRKKRKRRNPKAPLNPQADGFQPANRGKSYPAEPLSGDEVKALVAACSRRAPTGIRNAALIAVMYRGGLRATEALALKPKDVDFKQGSVRVLHGKGDKARVVALDDAGLALVQRWMDTRKARGITGRSRLFCTLDGGAMSTAYVRTMLPRIAKRAGIEKRVHAHGLRHSFAAELAAEGVPMNVVQRALGHSNLTTTSRYLDHIAPREVLKTLRSRVWVF